MGRPSLYTPEMAELIAERLAAGDSAAQIAESDDMPSLRTMMRWAAENEDFGTIYAHAREAQAEVMDRMILDAAAKAGDDPQAARVQIDAYKWRAARLNPKRYGDRIDVTSGNEKIAQDSTSMAVRAAALIRMGLDQADAGDV